MRVELDLFSIDGNAEVVLVDLRAGPSGKVTRIESFLRIATRYHLPKRANISNMLYRVSSMREAVNSPLRQETSHSEESLPYMTAMLLYFAIMIN